MEHQRHFEPVYGTAYEEALGVEPGALGAIVERPFLGMTKHGIGSAVLRVPLCRLSALGCSLRP